MGEYDLRVYTPELLPQVLDVLRHLWGPDEASNQAYFQWKYLDNPAVAQPLCIVALRQNAVIGFRGYFATRYHVPGQADPVLVLVPGDTCVHPDHRRWGLSVRMGELAMRSFAGIAPLFLNMTATHSSLPGYLKMGFLPLADKAYVSAYTLPGLLAYLATYRQRSGRPIPTVRFGTQGNISLSDQPRPAEMAGIIAQQPPLAQKIALVQDCAFFRWRFANPKRKYLFYFYQEQQQSTGYVVLGLSPNRRRGYVLDCADSDGVSVEKLLQHIISQREVDILSIYRFCMADWPDGAVTRLRLRQRGLLRMLEQRKTGELPLLIRPVKTTYIEADWHLGTFDVRDIRNWEIKEIGSDAV